MMSDRNSNNLKRFMTTYNGMLYVGKMKLSIHSTFGEDVFAIDGCKKRLEFSPIEAVELAMRILEAYPQKEK